MKIYNQNFSINNSNKPNFGSLYRVRRVELNGKVLDDFNGIWRVARALSSGMYKETLPKTLMETILEIFPDFCLKGFKDKYIHTDKNRTCPKAHFAITACNGKKIHNVHIMAGPDVVAYDDFSKNTSLSESKYIVLRRHFIRDALLATGNKGISIVAEENDGAITIKDVSIIPLKP